MVKRGPGWLAPAGLARAGWLPLAGQSFPREL